MDNENDTGISKYKIMVCELFHPLIHGKTESSYEFIDTYWMVNMTAEPKIYFFEVYYDEYDYRDDEYRECQEFYLDFVSLQRRYQDYYRRHYSHPVIKNYANIILRSDYIRFEIGEYIILPTEEAIAILKTFWLRIIQRKWKKVFKHRNEIIKLRCNPSNLRHREIHGKWPSNCDNFPTLNGMLSDLK